MNDFPIVRRVKVSVTGALRVRARDDRHAKMDLSAAWLSASVTREWADVSFTRVNFFVRNVD